MLLMEKETQNGGWETMVRKMCPDCGTREIADWESKCSSCWNRETKFRRPLCVPLTKAKKTEYLKILMKKICVKCTKPANPNAKECHQCETYQIINELLEGVEYFTWN